MLMKFLTLLGVAVALWSVARRAMGLVGGDAPPRPVRHGAADMVRCRACGAWRAPEEPCACRTPPTP